MSGVDSIATIAETPFTLTFFVLGRMFSGIAIARTPKPVGAL
jgi:hypothetical protein